MAFSSKKLAVIDKQFPSLKWRFAANQNRSVAYLNLADSLWAQGNRAEATKNYQSYQLLMKRTQRLSNMPNRVSDEPLTKS